MSEKWKELRTLLIMFGVFGLAYYFPFETERFGNGLQEAFFMLQDYARLHVLLCLVPALFIAGAVSVFISKDSVIKYLGASAPKWLAYSVAAVSGAILAVCSCTILPLFSGIYKRGAGLGPAMAFLYSGPAINVLAIVMTARILGLQLGIARAVGAIFFSIVIGLLMHLIFRKEEAERQAGTLEQRFDDSGKPMWQTIIYFGLMIFILITLNWAKPNAVTGTGFMLWMYVHKWLVAGLAALALGLALAVWYGLKLWKVLLTAVVVIVTALLNSSQPLIPYVIAIYFFSLWLILDKGELKDWLVSTWSFAKLIIPLLFIGVLIAGSLLGRPGFEAWIPSRWVETAVGGNSLWANLFASISGAFMYFATLTEVPILQGLLGAGMGKGPALALLLAGPALSLPSMLVINSVLGFKKTAVYVALVVIMSTLSGYIFGVWIA